jgi:hypothetical protein
MVSKYQKLLKGVALLTAFCLMQVYVFAGSTPRPQTGATLKTTNNQPVTVNGNSVMPGTTILSGSTIVTPAGVAATLKLDCTTLDIAPDSEVTVEFTSDGNVKVTLKRGCATLKTCGNSSGVIIAPDGTTTETGKKKRAAVCFPLGSTAPIVAAGGLGVVPDYLVPLLLFGGTAGTIAAIIFATRGQNTSPSSP